MTTDQSPPPGGDAPPPPEVPWTASVYDPAKPGCFSPDWVSKAPPTEAEMWQEYKDKTDPFSIIKHERTRRIEAQTALRNKQDAAAAAAGLPVKPEGDAATPEAIAAYRAARGLPPDPKGYGLARPADYPEQLWNDKESEEFAAFALEQEMSPATVKALTEWYQGKGKEALAAHQAALAAQEEAQRVARENYVRTQKETLIQNHGINVDRDLKTITKLTGIAGLDPEMLNPDNPDKWVGADVVKAMASIVAMLPKSGDPTARQMGNMGSAGKDRAYFQNLKTDHDDYKAMGDSSHPRHKTVMAERDAAYAADAALKAHLN